MLRRSCIQRGSNQAPYAVLPTQHSTMPTCPDAFLLRTSSLHPAVGERKLLLGTGWDGIRHAVTCSMTKAMHALTYWNDEQALCCIQQAPRSSSKHATGSAGSHCLGSHAVAVQSNCRAWTHVESYPQLPQHHTFDAAWIRNMVADQVMVTCRPSRRRVHCSCDHRCILAAMASRSSWKPGCRIRHGIAAVRPQKGRVPSDCKAASEPCQGSGPGLLGRVPSHCKAEFGHGALSL